MLYIVIGLPGTGKSTVSKKLAEKYDAVVLNADEFRRDLFDIDPTKKDQIFPEEWTDIPYRAIFLAARKLVQRNQNVVIDASLYSNKLVSEARSILPGSKVIQTTCPEHIAKQRLKERCDASGKNYSAGTKVYDHVKSLTESMKHIDFVINTDKELESQLSEI